MSKPQRIRYLPLEQAMPGMVLGAPVVLMERGVIRYSLPVNHELTEGNLEQLSAHRCEVVCITEDDERDDVQREIDFLRETARVDRIFALAERDSPIIRDLYQAVLAYRRQS